MSACDFDESESSLQTRSLHSTQLRSCCRRVGGQQENMPWEIYFRLERPIRWRPDEASLRVRLVALMLSKRAEQGSCIAHSEGVAEDTAQTWKILNAECWEHVARVCPVSVCTEWAVCPFDHWLDLPAAEFAAAYQQAGQHRWSPGYFSEPFHPCEV